MKNYIKIECNHKQGFPAWADSAFSLFQNRFGEQWLAAWRGDDLVISGGDIDWGEIVVPHADLFNKDPLPLKRDLPFSLKRLNLSDDELYWVVSVLKVAHSAAEAKRAR
jgi:hypothetical protein